MVVAMLRGQGGLQAKQTQYEEMSAGQASTMARNETEIDRSTEEMEDLEETLNESIAESIKSRQRQVRLHLVITLSLLCWSARSPAPRKSEKCGSHASGFQKGH